MFEVIENTYDASKQPGKGTVAPIQKIVKTEARRSRAQAYADKMNEAQSLRELSVIKTYYVRDQLSVK